MRVVFRYVVDVGRTVKVKVGDGKEIEEEDGNRGVYRRTLDLAPMGLHCTLTEFHSLVSRQTPIVGNEKFFG